MSIFMDICSFSALALHYTTEKLSDGQLLIHCWNNRPTFSYREQEKGGLCSKFRTVYTDVDPCRGEIKKKCNHFRSHIIWRGGEISNKMQPWHFQANYDLKKYSYVTCRGEQSPSKFDIHLHQVKSTFSCEADLNTVTAHQLKLTFGTKRLTSSSVCLQYLLCHYFSALYIEVAIVCRSVCEPLMWTQLWDAKVECQWVVQDGSVCTEGNPATWGTFIWLQLLAV